MHPHSKKPSNPLLNFCRPGRFPSRTANTHTTLKSACRKSPILRKRALNHYPEPIRLRLHTFAFQSWTGPKTCSSDILQQVRSTLVRIKCISYCRCWMTLQLYFFVLP